MLFQEFLNQLKSHSLQALPSLYIFTGPAKQVLELKEKGLRMLVVILTGAADISSDTVKRYDMANFSESEFWTELYAVPFLNQSRFVVLNIAEKADFLVRMEAQLKEYLAGKSFFTRLVIFMDKYDSMPVELSRLISKKAWVIECKSVLDEELPRWIIGQLGIYNKNISQANARLLAEKTGNDLAKIDAVLEKLVILHKDSQTISDESIHNFIDTERDFDIKELTDAIIGRQSARALKIAGQLLKKGDPVNKIIGFLRVGLAYNAKYQNNNALLVSRYNKLLSTDLAIKTGRLPEEMALQALIVKLTR